MAKAPFDTVETVLNTARVRLNDAIASLSGDVLTDTQPFTQVMANAAWRRLQEYLADKGYTTCRGDTVVTGIPKAASTDPSVECWLGWGGFFDGVNLNGSPVLPQNVTSPLKCYERLNGSNAPFAEPPMECMADGIRQGYGPQQLFNLQWEWRNNRIYIPGSLQVEDFRIVFVNYFPDFLTLANVAITAATAQNPTLLTAAGSGLIDGEQVTITGFTGNWTALNGTFTVTVIDQDTFSIPVNALAATGALGAPVFATQTWTARPVPIMRCLDSFADYIAAEMANARGDVDSSTFTESGMANANLIMNRDVRMKQRINVRRMSRSGRLEGSGYQTY
jgi:hypothetical protein